MQSEGFQTTADSDLTWCLWFILPINFFCFIFGYFIHSSTKKDLEKNPDKYEIGYGYVEGGEKEEAEADNNYTQIWFMILILNKFKRT